ncbi:MAG: hypothetical protein RL071_4767 [Pseudomonadota bacterium]|jgi:SAM-dependent methyltransferase
MSLAKARALKGKTPPLPPGPPYDCAELQDWVGRSFQLPPGDPRLPAIHKGGEAPTPQLDNLVGAVKYWEEHPEWMDIHDPESPSHEDRMLERSLYLRRWGTQLEAARRVLDLGGGVGRFTLWLLEQEKEVELVDPDLRSLWRAVSVGAATHGKLDVHWTTGERMPELAPVDTALLVEVLNYVEEPDVVLANVHKTLQPGGTLLVSVEARWGWAAALDAHDGTLDAFFTDGIVHQPGDRWVRTFEREAFVALLERAGFVVEAVWPSHYVLSGPFELAAGPLEGEALFRYEDLLAAHPIAEKLNRAWMAVAHKPG